MVTLLKEPIKNSHGPQYSLKELPQGPWLCATELGGLQRHRGSGEEPAQCLRELTHTQVEPEPRPYVGIQMVTERLSVPPAWAILLSFEVGSQ